MSDLKANIKEASSYIHNKIKDKPKVGVILGTGLGGFAKSLDIIEHIKYADIPHFPVSTVESHVGELLYGSMDGNNILAMQGRFHHYEGYSLQEITFPVRVMKDLGVEYLLISNAAGGMNPLYKRGDLAIIVDHINFMGVNPLVGPNDDELGPRFPDMCEPYDHKLIDLAEEIALEEKIAVKKGVYIGVTGPCLETPAEYRFMRQIGADIVGMSTVPEVIVGVHAGLKVFAVSCITDMCLPDALKPVAIEEIIEIAEKTEPHLYALMTKMVGRIFEL